MIVVKVGDIEKECGDSFHAERDVPSRVCGWYVGGVETI